MKEYIQSLKNKKEAEDLRISTTRQVITKIQRNQSDARLSGASSANILSHQSRTDLIHLFSRKELSDYLDEFKTDQIEPVRLLRSFTVTDDDPQTATAPENSDIIAASQDGKRAYDYIFLVFQSFS